MRTVLMPTTRCQRVLVQSVSLFQLHYRTAHGIRTTESEGQALRVSLVKPVAYLSASYRNILTTVYLLPEVRIEFVDFISTLSQAILLTDRPHELVELRARS